MVRKPMDRVFSPLSVSPSNLPTCRLDRAVVEKPWGRTVLPAPFQSMGRQIGEIWFVHPEGHDLPLLIKYLFTSEPLSVQVHPDDLQARALGLPGGKSECWYVLDCPPDAVIGLGLRTATSAQTLRAAALDGSIETLIHWQPVKAGDFFFIPAGMIHAIGAGISLVEVQQNCDITFRLYDYGRDRPLHLEEGMAIARARPYDQPVIHAPVGTRARLLDEGRAPFSVSLHAWKPHEETPWRAEKPCWFIPLSGSGAVGGKPWTAGECWWLQRGAVLTFELPTNALIAWQDGPE